MTPIDIIRKIYPLPLELEEALAAEMHEETFRKGDIIKGTQNFTNVGYFINHGAARLFYTLKGKEHTVSFSFEDQFIAVTPYLLKAHPETLCIQFIEPTVVTYCHSRRLKEIVNERLTVTQSATILFFSVAVLQYNLMLEERINVMQTFNARERYKWALERFPRITECATTTQIASFLGVTKETLYRIRSGTY